MSFFVLIETDASEAVAVLDALMIRSSPVGLSAFLDTVVDPWVRNRIDQRFNSEGDEVSGSWDPLAAATQQIRASYGFPPDHPINVRTGMMRNFLVGTPSDVKPNGFGADLQHPPPGAGSSVMQKKIQTAQSGSSNPNTVARPVVGLNENDMIFITSSLAAWLTQDMIP
jgi:hypothetical protein